MKKIVAAIAVIAVLVLTGIGVWHFTSSQLAYSGMSEPITIGEFPYETSALIYIAEDLDIFSGNGLNVILRDYNSTPAAISGLLNDDVDISGSAEYTIVGDMFKKENISVIGCIDKFQTTYIIGRKDRGIVNVSDLKGKKIGVHRGGGIGEFYLGRFLDLHGISMQDVTPVDIPPSQWVQAITNGSVDALVGGAYIDQIQKRLGSNIILWPAQSNQSGYWVMSCRDGWAASHPEQINRLLKSLDQAEVYTINHPDVAKAIVQKRMNYTDRYMATAWPDHQFSLSLDQSLLIAMNDEGRWMINNNLTNEKTLPYFRDYIYTKALEKVKPEAVNIR
jgi:NitT/TauT family transport system substrate-binding protein